MMNVKPGGASIFDRFLTILKYMVDQGGSDLHISVGGGFRIRVKGSLIPVPDSGDVTPTDAAAIAANLLIAGRKCTRENVAAFIENLTDFDLSYAVPALGRYRVNVACQRRSLAW